MTDKQIKTRRPDGRPETAADKRFFDARESGYTGPIDHEATSGRAADVLAALRRRSK